MPLPDGTGNLQRVATTDGFRFRIGGVDVGDGNAVDLLHPDGAWKPGRLQWDGDPSKWPVLRVSTDALHPDEKALFDDVAVDEVDEPLDRSAVLRVAGRPAHD